MKAIVIGGGIIGLSSAYYLKKSGWEVEVFDKTDMLGSCSTGNLGMIVPSHFVPLAAPGMISQGIKWMFNSRSPFYVKPSLNMDLFSWGLKFMKSATNEHVERSATALAELSLLSKNLYQELEQQNGFDFSLENKGIIMYYKTEKTGDEENHLAAKALKMGLDVVPLSRTEAQALEPEVELDVLGGVHYRCDAHLYPNKLIEQLVQWLQQNNVRIYTNTTVQDVVLQQATIKKVITSQGSHEADVVVLAAGSWMPELAKKLHLSLPLMPGKGYTFTDRAPKKKLNIPAILCEARVAITPMNGYMRYGGTMEIAPVKNSVNLKRVEGIVQSLPKYFRNLDVIMPEEKDVWFGFRPCSPDGLPYIGKPGKINNLVIAGGHAMMGLSLGPASGKVISDLANGQKPEVDIRVFHPDRFC